MLARGAAVTACAVAGVILGASEHDRITTLARRAGSILAPDAQSVDRHSVTALLEHGASITRTAPENCGILATNRAGEAPALRVVLIREPFGVHGSDVAFHTNGLSRKVSELRRDPLCSLTCWDPARLAYVTYEGAVKQLDHAEATALWRPWLRLFYPDGADGDQYTAWMLCASTVQAPSQRHITLPC